MDTLKEIISNNEGSFNNERLKAGNLLRFITKLPKWERPVWVLYPAFAAIALAFILIMPTGEQRAIKIYKQYCYEVGIMTGEIQAMTSEDQMRLLDLALDRITYEAVPLFDELPEELNGRQKAKLMKDYYKKKLDGVAKLKALVADAEEF